VDERVYADCALQCLFNTTRPNDHTFSSSADGHLLREVDVYFSRVVN
jgi:hypothetical protein